MIKKLSEGAHSDWIVFIACHEILNGEHLDQHLIDKEKEEVLKLLNSLKHVDSWFLEEAAYDELKGIRDQENGKQ